jgi:hypothetical protein
MDDTGNASDYSKARRLTQTQSCAVTVALPGTALIRLLFGLFDGGRHLGDGHQGPRDLVEQLVRVFLLCQ